MTEGTEKPNNKNKGRSIVVIALALIIIMQLVRIIYVFEVKKTGLHSDEVWSYGLANSYYDPHLFMTANGGEFTYQDRWLDGETFRNYLTVDEEHRFRYDSVLYNMKHDMHPPMYFAILHTISSFFPGRISLWYAFSINLISFVIVQILLFIFTRKLFKSDLLALAAVAFFGFSIGALDIYVFLRPYVMISIWTLMLFIGHYNILSKKDLRWNNGNYICIAAATCLGVLTDFFFIPFAFAVAVLFCVGFMLKKRWKQLGVYCAWMLSSMLVALPFSAISANALGHSSMDPNNTIHGVVPKLLKTVENVFNALNETYFDKNLNTILRDFVYDWFGIRSGFSIPQIIVYFAFVCMALAVVIVIMLCVYSAVYGDRKLLGIKTANKVRSKVMKTSKEGLVILAIIAASILEIYFVSGFAEVAGMNELGNRYVFILYPYVGILIAALVLKAAKKISGKKEAVICVAAVLLILCLLCNIKSSCLYLFTDLQTGNSLRELTKDKKAVLVLNEPYQMTIYSYLMFDADEVFVTSNLKYKEHIPELQAGLDEDTLLIMDLVHYQVKLCYRNDIDYKTLRYDEMTDLFTKEELEAVYLDEMNESLSPYWLEYFYSDRIGTGWDIAVYRVNKR